MSKIQGSAFIQPIKDGSDLLATSALQQTQQTTLNSINDKLVSQATSVGQAAIVTAIENLDLTATGQAYVWSSGIVLTEQELAINGTLETDKIDLGATYSHPVKPFYVIELDQNCEITVQLLGSFDDTDSNNPGTYYELDQPYTQNLNVPNAGTLEGKMYSLNDVAVPRFYKIRVTATSGDSSNPPNIKITHGAWLKPDN